MMGYNHVKTVTGWIIILGHLGLAVTAVIVLGPYLNGSQLVDVLLVLSPITLAYFTAVVTGFIRGKFDKGPGRAVNYNFAGVAILIPIVLTLFVAYVLLSYPNGIASDVSTLQRWIAGVEAVLGTTVGLVVNDLFPTTDPNVNTQNIAPAPAPRP
jgi:hypothetical protein